MNEKHVYDYKDRLRDTFGWYNQRLKWNYPIILNIAENEITTPTTIPTLTSTTVATSAAASDIQNNNPGDMDGSFSYMVVPDPMYHNEKYLYEIVYPLLAVGAGIVLITILLIVLLLSKKRKKVVDTEGGRMPNILIYPNKGSTGPQFLTKEIHFSVPPIRSTSLGDLEENPSNGDEADLELDSNSLTPSSSSRSNCHTHRSNSFSSYGLGTLDPTLYTNTPEMEVFDWPDGHLGRIWFTMKYEPASEKLLLTLLKIKNLPSRIMGTVSTCDPYVRLHLIPDERRVLQSRQKKKTCNPCFDETFVFQVPAKDMTDHILKLTVLDAGRTKPKDPVIGNVTFPLRNLNVDSNNPMQEPKLYWFDLDKEVQETISELGELLISLVYNANLNRLTVMVVEGRKLKIKDETRDIYVRITLNQQYKAVKIKRTRAARPSADGIVTFAEGFNFRVPISQQDVTSVVFHLFHTSTGYGKEKLIGKCILGSYMFARGKAQTQWNAAFANPMEQVQQWHTLSE